MSGLTIPTGRMSIVVGIAAILLGIIALILPVLGFDIIEYLFAFYAIVMSAGMAVAGFNHRKTDRFQGLFLLVAGFVGILIGLSILIAPRFMAVAAIDILGIWAIVAGLSDIVYVFSTAGGSERSFKAATGILTLIAGLVILGAPKLIDGYVLVTLAGIFAILAGILTILFGTAKPPEKKPVNHYIYK